MKKSLKNLLAKPLNKSFRFVLLVAFVLLSNFVSTGQSLVMSGNEIFQQESPSKLKEAKNAQKNAITNKYLKQKGTIVVPNIKPDKGGTTLKSPKILEDTERKPRYSTLSEDTENAANYRSTIMWIILKMLQIMS